MPSRLVTTVRYIIIAIFVAVMTFMAYELVIEYTKIQEVNRVVEVLKEKQAVDQATQRQSERRSRDPGAPDNDAETKIEIVGVVNFELSERTSWTTVYKLLVTVLGTWFGIRLINHVFRRLGRAT